MVSVAMESHNGNLAATENRSLGNDLLLQDSILNEGFERGSNLCLKSRLSFGKNFRRGTRLGQRSPDQVSNRDLTACRNRRLKCRRLWRIGVLTLQAPRLFYPSTRNHGAFFRSLLSARARFHTLSRADSRTLVRPRRQCRSVLFRMPR